MPPVATSEIWSWLADIPDPEVPAVSIIDLGIVREVEWNLGAPRPRLEVVVTPTYSGCPATEVIAGAIRDTLAARGIPDATVRTRLAPAWTTDWLSPQAREKLRAYGIAPPAGLAQEQVIDASHILRRALRPEAVECPRCGSTRTEPVSHFGSTPCKALHRCLACREPFDYFKPH